MKKRVLNILLCIIMFGGLLPITTLASPCNSDTCVHTAAIGSEHYDTIQEAVDAAQNGDTILVIRTHELICDNFPTNSDGYATLVNVLGKSVTIDLNGKTLSVNPKASQFSGAKSQMLLAVFAADEGASLTLMDSSDSQSGSVKLTKEEPSFIVYSLAACYGTNSHLNITSGTYWMNESTSGRGMIYDNWAHFGADRIVVTGGNFYLGNVGMLDNYSPWIFNVSGKNDGEILVCGGTFNANVLQQRYVLETDHPYNKTITDNGDGTWTITDASAWVNNHNSNGDTIWDDADGFRSLEAAIEKANENDSAYQCVHCGKNKVTLLSDCQISSTLPTITKNITFVPNNHVMLWNGANDTPVLKLAAGVQIEGFELQKTGYNLVGWYTDAEYKNVFDWDTVPTEEVQLFAKWVAKVSQEINFDTADRHATYGDGALEARAATASTAITYASSDNTVATVDATGVVTVLKAGETVITATAVETEEFASASAEYQLTVAPKALTITADDKSAYVGEDQPELTYQVDGLVNGDSLTVLPTLHTDADMDTYGAYEIIPAAAEVSSNYIITYVNGTLTVRNTPVIVIIRSYKVEIAKDILGGTVNVNGEKAREGSTITVTVTPDDGYVPAALTVTDSVGNAIAVIKLSETEYSFTMPACDVVVDAEFVESDLPCNGGNTCPLYSYVDLDPDAWYHDSVHYCVEHDLMEGIGTNVFAPTQEISRAMIVTILWRLEGEPVVAYETDFDDVAANTWYTKAVRWATSEKLVEGYGDGTFGTDDAITREQFATILYRYARFKGYDVSAGYDTDLLTYGDAAEVSDWAIAAIRWACGSDLMQGDGKNLTPVVNATRAQAAALFERFCKKIIP